MVLFLALLTLTLAAELKYNEIAYSTGIKTFEFSPLGNKNTLISVVSSNYAEILLRENKIPNDEEYDYKSLNTMIIPATELNQSSIYFLHVYSLGEFSVRLSLSDYTQIEDSIPVAKSIQSTSQELFTYSISQDTKKIKVSLIFYNGNADIFINQEGSPTILNSYKSRIWHFGKVIDIDTDGNEKIYISVFALENTDYVIIIDVGKEILIKDLPVPAEVNSDAMNFYRYVFPEYSILKIKLSIFSGECDLYIRVNSQVSKLVYDWGFTDHGSKVIELTQLEQQKHPGTNYSIGVFGKKSSAYLLSISSSNFTITAMMSGIPYIGSIRHNDIEYYSFDLAQDNELLIHLSAATGNPDIYSKQCFSSPKDCIFTEKDISSPGSNIVYSNNSFSFEEINLKSTGIHIIGVIGKSLENSEYSIVAIINNEEIMLKSGTPQTATIANGGYRLYKYHVARNSASELHFMLTPISGNPDLYVSLSQIPNKDIYDSSSALSGMEVDSITYKKGRDFNELNGTYHIAVYSEGPTQYSIVAKETHPNENTTIQLYPGIPQKDTLTSPCKSYRFYYFPIHFTNETKQQIRISLTPITGSFHIYVANNIENIDFVKRIFWYNWESNSSSTDIVNTVTINPVCGCYKLNSNYAVLVKALNFSSDNTATYSIVLQLGNGTTFLTDNSPFIDILLPSKYNYYTFPITLNRENLLLKLTSFSGNPQMFISVNTTKPTSEDYQFKSHHKGSGEVQLMWEKLETLCPALPSVYHHGDSTYCSIFIGVTSDIESSYSITIHTTRVIVTQLIIPSTQFSLLSPDAKYFYSRVDSDRDVFISTQSSIGVLKFYVKLYTTMQTSPENIIMPNETYNDLVSDVYMIHSEKVTVTAEFMKAKCGTSCIIAISGVCQSVECEFFISVTQDQMIHLIAGEAFLGSVAAEEYMYFSYYCDREDHDFLIDLSPISNGDPDLYVKKSLNELPSKTSNDWQAQTWQSETLLITSSDPYFSKHNITITGTYLIAVYSLSACSFTIRVTQDPKPVVKLTSGIPDHGTVKAQDYTYYYYRSSIQSDVVFKITPYYGKAIIYVNTQELYTDELYEKLPSINNYQFTSMQDISQHSLTIKKDNINFCVSCNFIIAVYGESDCEYSITAMHGLNLTLLENGIPHRGENSKHQWVYYYFEVTENSDLDFSLTTFSGDADLFISTEPDVTFNNAKWSSVSITNYDHVVISKSHEDFKLGSLYIGVYSLVDSSFTITAHMRQSFVTLISGLPQSYNLAPGDVMYFQYWTSSIVAQDVTCSLHPSIANFKPNVYAVASKSPHFPDESAHYQYTERNYEEFYCWLTMKFRIEHNQRLYLAVKGKEQEAYNFTLSCYGVDDVNVINHNQEYMERIELPLTKKIYEVNSQYKGTLTVYVIPCEGMQKLEVSSNWTLANMGIPDISVTRLTDWQLIATLNNAIGRYYITVTSVDDGNFYNASTYLLYSYFTSPNIHEHLYPGNDGKIDLKQENDGVRMTWQGPVHENRTRFSQGRVIYTVYAIEENVLTSACSIMVSAERGKAIKIAETNETSFVFKGKKDTIVNVIATLPVIIKIQRYLPYDPIKVKPGSKKANEASWLLVMLCILVLAIIGLIFYFVRKTKQIQQQLDIEMTHGRNLPIPGIEKIPLSEAIDYSGS
ncbi:hypothetical protein SteCoe_22853 [Stentor coeruleus]|uniref:Uncharacterized protein n=1 Tax=Stentor coeruleus TaxID=5963 RepID=A0A1R2BLV0_9CILI|nr:hypothetical protein SteCoe_22853 [Stentor coeruleus]